MPAPRPRAPPTYTGHINHSMFWEMLTPPKNYEPPSGALASAITADFGSLEAMTTKFSAAAAGVQGSGWGWLGYNKDVGKLVIATTGNQDPLQPTTGLVPLLGIDVWEHAYVSFAAVFLGGGGGSGSSPALSLISPPFFLSSAVPPVQ